MKNIFAVIITILLIAVGAIWFFYRGGDMPINEIPNEQGTVSQFIPEGKSKLDMYHTSDNDGTHTYEGTIALPTPCHSFQTGTTMETTSSEKISIDLTIIEGKDICAQVISNRTFSVSFSASEDHTVSLRINGTTIPTMVHDGALPKDSNGEAPIELQ